MSIAANSRSLLPEGNTRPLLIKWLVALLVPLSVFTFVWHGEAIVNNVFLSLIAPQLAGRNYNDVAKVIQIGLFITVFYVALITLAGYLVASDSGRRPVWEVWSDIFFATVVPLLLVMFTEHLLIGLSFFAIVWTLYLLARKYVRKAVHYVPPPVLDHVEVLDSKQQQALVRKGILGGFWFATAFAVISLVADLIFYLAGGFPEILFIWVALRTILLPVAGYFLGLFGGRMALRYAITPKVNENANKIELNEKEEKNGKGWKRNATKVSKQQQLEHLSASRAREEAKDLVPNDLPLQSKGAARFFLTILAVFLLFYPVIDPILFGSGSAGRITGYADLGYYIILALGLNIVVGFAGLLDLGYVAFYVIGTYTWAMFGSTQFSRLTSIAINTEFWPWLFWPMLIIAALIAAFWGVLLGAPTLRLRGDYLAIVTLGFGEIIPIFFLNLDNITGGTNGIVGVFAPVTPCIQPFFCVTWSSYNPIPFYYLILVLIVVCIFINVRLRDSRLGRAWVAIREDEIAASSSGINLVNTKLFAFGAGAFFAGIAGAYSAAKLGTVAPSNFSSTDSIIYLAMVVIGGIGSIPGVIVGAVVVYAINLLILARLDSIAAEPGNVLNYVTQVLPNFTFSNIRNLLFGVILIVIMIFRPEGLLPSTRRKRELHKADEEDKVETTSLDEPPGSARFEAETRVE